MGLSISCKSPDHLHGIWNVITMLTCLYTDHPCQHCPDIREEWMLWSLLLAKSWTATFNVSPKWWSDWNVTWEECGHLAWTDKKKTNSSPPSKYNNMKSVEGYLYTTTVIRQIAKKKKKNGKNNCLFANSEIVQCVCTLNLALDQ